MNVICVLVKLMFLKTLSGKKPVESTLSAGTGSFSKAAEALKHTLSGVNLPITAPE